MKHAIKFAYPIFWKSWYESRIRFIILLVILLSLVGYIVLTGPAFVKGYAKLNPEGPMDINEYIWQSLFNYYLQGLWVISTIVLALGGLLREYDLGISSYTLSLPVSRSQLLKTRFLVGAAQSALLGLIPSALIPLFSLEAGFHYPFLDAIGFGFLLITAGLAIFSFSYLLSCIFSDEFSALLISLFGIGLFFFLMKMKRIHQWSIFDVMNGARSIDPRTHLFAYQLPWTGLLLSLGAAFSFYFIAVALIRQRDL